MKIEKSKCDTCGKETEDYYGEQGWIRPTIQEITFCTGRNKRGTAKTKFYRNLELDFCSNKCMKKWIDNKSKGTN